MKKLLLSLTLLLSTVSTLAIASGYKDVSDPQSPRTDDGKIEVEAVFWYGCPHCYKFEPVLNKVEEALPDDVEMFHVPAPLSPAWARHARIYYTGKKLGVLDRSHQDVFDKLHEENGRGLLDADSVAEFFTQYDLDKDKVTEVYNSKAIDEQLSYDRDRLTAYGLTGVPTLIVDGKYVISGNTVQGGQGMVGALAEVIKMERRAKAQSTSQ